MKESCYTKFKTGWREYWKTIIPYIAFSVLILLVVECCLLEDKKDPPSIVAAQFDKTLNEEKLKVQTGYLIQKNSISYKSVESKQSLAWAAFALYLTGLVFSLKPMLRETKRNCYYKTIFILILLLFLFSVFAFIHAQYSNIYATTARQRAADAVLEEILKMEDPLLITK